MNDYIDILVLYNNSINVLSEIPLIYQGSSQPLYLNIEFEKSLDDNTVVELMFRRSDGNMTSYLPTKKIGDTYQFKCDSSWYFSKAGNLTYTIKVKRVLDEENAELLLTSYSTIPVLASPDALFVPAPLRPTAYDIITNKLVEFDNLKNEDPIINIVGNIEPLDSNYARVKFVRFSGNEGFVDIKMPSGLFTDKDFENEINKLNPVINIVETDEDLQFEVSNASGTKTVTLKSKGIAKKSDLETLSEDLVSYTNLGSAEEVATQVYRATVADKAVADENGNNITETYIPNKGGTSVDRIAINTYLDFKKQIKVGTVILDEIENKSMGITGADGMIGIDYYVGNDLSYQNHRIDTGVVDYKNNRTDGEVVSVDMLKLPQTDKINIFDEPQIISEQIGLKNADGTIDYIKHLNKNFLISGSNGNSLLNIDENLNKVYFLNKEVVFTDTVNSFINNIVGDVESNINADINNLENKIVFVEATVGNQTFKLIPNATNTVATGYNNKSYVVQVYATHNSVSVTNIILPEGASANINTAFIRAIKVGEL